MEPTKYIIYRVINLKTRKHYIGKTRKTLDNRWSVHKAHAKHGMKYSKTSGKKVGQTYIYHSMRKYGIENFEIKQIDTAYGLKHSVFLEGFYIKYYKSNETKYGYNLMIDDYEEGNEFLSEKSRKLISKGLRISRVSINKTSGFRGVGFGNDDGRHSNKPWVCRISNLNYKKCKRFETKEEAALAYDKLYLYLTDINCTPPNFPQNKELYKLEDLKHFYEWFIEEKEVTSRYINVNIMKDGKFMSRIIDKDKKRYSLGVFESEIEAAEKYDKMRLFIYNKGPYNFPEKLEQYKQDDLSIFYNAVKHGLKNPNKKTSSKYLGVCKHKQIKHLWCWEIKANGKRIRGSSHSECGAAIKRDAAAIQNQLSKMNFPISYYEEFGIDRLNSDKLEEFILDKLPSKINN